MTKMHSCSKNILGILQKYIMGDIAWIIAKLKIKLTLTRHRITLLVFGYMLMFGSVDDIIKRGFAMRPKFD